MFGLYSSVHAESVSDSEIKEILSSKNIDIGALRAKGRDVLPVMARVYESTNDELFKAKVAWSFYQLGWRSEPAKQVLMRDIHTTNSQLRLQVQWALGRVSNDKVVVTNLLTIMQHDENPLFRDKAACALASDQIHLSPAERFPLLEGLVKSLDDPKPQVRSIAIQALKIQTGQDKGYQPNDDPENRVNQIEKWNQWLEEYRSNL